MNAKENPDSPPAATAHRYWDEQWRTAPAQAEWAGAGWARADPWVTEVIPELRRRGTVRALDLGCGLGRHAVALARAGFEACGLDASAAALERTSEAAREAGVALDVRSGALDSLPYPDGHFGYVLAFNVVYHGTEDTLAATLAEIRRVLRPGGLYQCTMLSKRNVAYGRGTEIAPNAFVQPGGPGDKAHPHLYCDERDLARLHHDFRLLSLAEADQGHGEYHWYCLLEAGG